MGRLQSRGQHLCNFIGTKESVYRGEEFSQLPQDWLARQQGRGFIVLEHQYGRRDVM